MVDRWRRVVVTALAACALAACTVAVPGTGHPARGAELAALPFDSAERVLAGRMAEFRTWDVCAMHDVAAAERTAAALAFAVRPTRGLDGCEIALEDGASGRLSYVSIELGVVVPASGPAAELRGRSFPRVAAVQGSEDRAECGYARPVALGWGVLVRGEVTDDPTGSCALAREYLGEVLPRLDDPPRRAAAGTDPAFGLATEDPCAAVAAIVRAAVDVSFTGPHDCTADAVTVAFELLQFEVDAVGTRTAAGGERLEAVREGDACEVTLQASDTTLLAPSLPYLHRESVTVTAPDCDAARGHAEQIVATLPPPITPAVGALALGSLEGHPVAADVGAPFDPCSTVGWSAFPAAVRPPGVDPRPFPSPVGADTLYRVGCDFDSDAVTSVVGWGPAAGGFSIDPAVRPGVATRFAGRPGLEDRTVSGPGEPPLCLSTMQLANGLAAVITLARETDADLCAVNRSVLEALAPLVP